MRPIRSVGRRHSLRRRGGAAAAVAAGALFALAGAARANAPNPLSEHVSTSTAGSGAVTVTLNGTWDWGTLTTEPGEKSSPQLNCAGRYGVGWAVDWQDPSASPWNDAATLKADTITKNGVSFAAAPNYDGMYLFDDPCTAPRDANGFPTGPWSASHTYRQASNVPSTICVNFYDPHGKAGKPSGGVAWPQVDQLPSEKRSSDFVATGPHHDGDNSIETNSYNPAPGGNCAKVTVAPATTASPAASPAPASPAPAASAAPAARPPAQVLGVSISRAAPSSPSSAAAAPAAPAAAQPRVAASAARRAGLASTGADIAGLCGISLAALGTGYALVRKSRRGRAIRVDP